MKVYAMRDNVAELWYAPSIYHNDAEATREFNQIMMAKPYEYRRKDYDLFRIGNFDEHTGTLIGELPVVVFNGVSTKKIYEEDDLNDLL